MNSPTEQATLYRKAAETIEMCAEHGIKPMVKMCGLLILVIDSTLKADFKEYEFPLAVIEGRLGWADTVVYCKTNGLQTTLKNVSPSNMHWYTLTKPKQPLCEVEGKPVYKGDKLWNVKGWPKPFIFEVSYATIIGAWGTDGMGGINEYLSWNQPKRTVMVELSVEDAESFLTNYAVVNVSRIGESCRKALDNLK